MVSYLFSEVYFPFCISFNIYFNIERVLGKLESFVISPHVIEGNMVSGEKTLLHLNNWTLLLVLPFTGRWLSMIGRTGTVMSPKKTEGFLKK